MGSLEKQVDSNIHLDKFLDRKKVAMTQGITSKTVLFVGDSNLCRLISTDSDYNRGREEFSSALKEAGYNLHTGCPDDLFKAMTFSQLQVIVSENGMFPEQDSALSAIDEVGGIIVLCIGWCDIEATTEVDIAAKAFRNASSLLKNKCPNARLKMVFVHNTAYPGPEYGPFAELDEEGKQEKYLAHQLKVIDEWRKEINDTEEKTKFKVFEGSDIDYLDDDSNPVEGPTKFTSNHLGYHSAPKFAEWLVNEVIINEKVIFEP